MSAHAYFHTFKYFVDSYNCVVSFLLYNFVYTKNSILWNLLPTLEINDHTLEVFMKISDADSVIS
jgi:hypothetical protein